MPGDTITLTSTTDTENDVKAALGVAVEEPPVPEAVTPAVEEAEPTPEQEEAGAEQQALQDGAAAARRKKGRLQSRIDELTEKASRTTGENAALKAQIAIYEQRLAQMAGVAPQTPPKVADPAPKAEVKLPAKPQVGDFQTYEEYTEAIADWKIAVSNAKRDADIEKLVEARIRQKEDAEAKQTAEARRKAAGDRYRERSEAAREKYPDFDERVNNPEIKASNLVLNMLVDSEHGPEIAYYIASHKEIADKLYALGDTAMAMREFGKIEARVESALEAAAAPTAARSDVPAKATPPVGPPAGDKPVTKPVATKAPDPITPVGGGNQATVTTDPSTMSYQDYRTWRAQQERKRAGLK